MNTLFDLSQYETRPAAGQNPAWVVFYLVNGREFLLRQPKRRSEYDPAALSFPADKPKRYKPRCFKTRWGAVRWAQQLQRTKLSDGQPVRHRLMVRRWN